MVLTRNKYYILLIISFMMSVYGKAQQAGVGGGLLYIDFGQAPTDIITVAGPPLQTGRTEFQYSNNVCPPQGMYSVVSGAPQNCNDSSLIALFADNTPFPDNNGYMMILQDVAHSTPKILFEHTIVPCPEVDYEFSTAFINLDKPNGPGCTRFSSFTMEVRDGAGVLLGATSTGDMRFAANNFGYVFNKLFVRFRLTAANILPVTVKIIDEPKAVSTCHNFIGIDDIKVTVSGIKTDIQFDDTPQGYGWWVKACCFQDNKSFTMNATVETNIHNPALQWEQSTDDGFTWRDIPGATGYQLTQSFPVADTFLFRLRVADSLFISTPDCGTASKILRVQVDGIPLLHNASNNSPVCTGSEIKFNAEGGIEYEWHGPNGFYDNIKFPGIYTAALKDSGWYYATIQTYGGCRITDSTYVKLVGTDVKAGPDTAICIGNSVKLAVNEAVTYTWTPSAGLSDATSRHPLASPNATISYTVTIKDDYGCSGTDKVTVAVKNKIPVAAKINSSKYLCRKADSILFVNNGAGVIDTWLWNFGNGKTSNEKSPPVQYYNNVPDNIFSYTVHLTVTDTAGCSDETYQTLKVEDMCNMAVPSAFTPNGDGRNDYFWPLNAFKANDIVFRVFNRSGNKIFETRQSPDKWDGTFKGEPQAPGTYVWVFEYTDAFRKKQVQKGTVVLIR